MTMKTTRLLIFYERGSRIARYGSIVLKSLQITTSDKIHLDQVIAALLMPREDTVSSAKIQHGHYRTVINSQLPTINGNKAADVEHAMTKPQKAA